MFQNERENFHGTIFPPEFLLTFWWAYLDALYTVEHTVVICFLTKHKWRFIIRYSSKYSQIQFFWQMSWNFEIERLLDFKLQQGKNRTLKWQFSTCSMSSLHWILYGNKSKCVYNVIDTFSPFDALFLIAWLADGDSLVCFIGMMGKQIAKMFSTFSLWGSLFLMI